MSAPLSRAAVLFFERVLGAAYRANYEHAGCQAFWCNSSAILGEECEVDAAFLFCGPRPAGTALVIYADCLEGKNYRHEFTAERLWCLIRSAARGPSKAFVPRSMQIIVEAVERGGDPWPPISDHLVDLLIQRAVFGVPYHSFPHYRPAIAPAPEEADSGIPF